MGLGKKWTFLIAVKSHIDSQYSKQNHLRSGFIYFASRFYLDLSLEMFPVNLSLWN